MRTIPFLLVPHHIITLFPTKNTCSKYHKTQPKMSPLSIFSVILMWTFFAVSTLEAAASSNSDIYIVYLGSATTENLAAKGAVLTSLQTSGRRELDVVRTYQHGLAGFAARMSPEEAKAISAQPGVLSVFRDTYYKPLTTRSWDFLQSLGEDATAAGPAVPSTGHNDSDVVYSSSDIVIGIIDTGIWPESPSFGGDKAWRIPPPAGWNGTCETSKDFNKSACNGKIVGARFYMVDGSARDIFGHGTHVASIAAGMKVKTSYEGLAAGTARGGSERSRIAVYNVCDPHLGCGNAAILSAFDDAISDGVKVISISMGEEGDDDEDKEGLHDFLVEDGISIGAFHAVERGITVVCAGGNFGPHPGTIGNDAPWIVTVASSTTDREIQNHIMLGGGTIIKGEALGIPKVFNRSAVYPLTSGEAAKERNVTSEAARNCRVGTLRASKIKGKIVFCENSVGGITDVAQQDVEVPDKGGVGVITVDDIRRRVTNFREDYPTTVISSQESFKLKAYLKSTRKPVATFLPSVTVVGYKPAPQVYIESSRGPSNVTANIIKPDIMAPGVNILAAWASNDYSYTVETGTSMACPHVSGVAANVKSAMPFLSPTGVKSAIMTTAFSTNNARGPITTDEGDLAGPYDMGAGLVHPAGAVSPGLVYETTTEEFLHFLCYRGYNTTTVRAMSRTASPSFCCPAGGANPDAISSLNYPSISVGLSRRVGRATRTIPRRLTNVALAGQGTYWVYKVSVGVDDAEAVAVKVFPKVLRFSEIGETKEFKVRFESKGSSTDDAAEKKVVTGWIKWSNPQFTVRSVFVVTLY